MAALTLSIIIITIFIASTLITPSNASHINRCRSYCGNITIDYPFAVQNGCGHPGFRELLFCMNDVLMFHIKSGSYRVVEIDYAYRGLTLHEPHLSTCDDIVLGGRGNGFSIEPWRAPYLTPDGDNVFMLIGCSARSLLFQGFPDSHLPCQNVSGMGCEDYYACPAWTVVGGKRVGDSGPPECCGVPFQAIKNINLSILECEGYSSAYSLAPLRVSGPSDWSYGIRVKYSLQGSDDDFCRGCEATGGTCGYATDSIGIKQLCICATSNSTSNCDSAALSLSASNRRNTNFVTAGILICISVLVMTRNRVADVIN